MTLETSVPGRLVPAESLEDSPLRLREDGRLKCFVCDRRVAPQLMRRYMARKPRPSTFEGHRRWICEPCWRRMFMVEVEE
jgi:hypothetical protein